MPVENLLRFEEQQFGVIFFKNTNFSPNSTRYLQVAQTISIMGLASKNMSHLNKIGSIFYFLFYENLLESVSCSMKWFNNRSTYTHHRLWRVYLEGWGGGGVHYLNNGISDMKRFSWETNNKVNKKKYPILDVLCRKKFNCKTLPKQLRSDYGLLMSVQFIPCWTDFATSWRYKYLFILLQKRGCTSPRDTAWWLRQDIL